MYFIDSKILMHSYHAWSVLHVIYRKLEDTQQATADAASEMQDSHNAAYTDAWSWTVL
jgi:hypothetical protein